LPRPAIPVGAERRKLAREGRAERRRRFWAWQDRVRDPALSVLLAMQIFGIFIAVPLAAEGHPLARTIADSLVLLVLAIVVLLSRRPGAIVLILFGAGAASASLLFGGEWQPAVAVIARRAGDIVAFAALAWVTGAAVYAPGRITSHRLQGAVVVYLSVALVFAAAYGLIWELSPHAFANLKVSAGGDAETAALLYFSLTTLTTTGYGDIVAVDPFARSLANLEAVLGVFYLAITVSRLVTLQLADRRR
jgi:Ion channel